MSSERLSGAAITTIGVGYFAAAKLLSDAGADGPVWELVVSMFIVTAILGTAIGLVSLVAGDGP